MWTVKRGNEGEQDTHLGAVYWTGPQGALWINPCLTPGANHNFKASLCPISLWPQGQAWRQPLRMVSPLDSLEMDGVFLSDMHDVRVLISPAKGANWAPWCTEFTMASQDTVARTSVQQFSAKLCPQWLRNLAMILLFLGCNKGHLPSPLKG